MARERQGPSCLTIATEICEKIRLDVDVIGTQMTLILCDRKAYKKLLLLDSTLDARPLLSKALIRLSRASGLHPNCFPLSDLEKIGQQVTGGGFSDIWKGLVRGQTVAVKIMRLFQETAIEAALKQFGSEALIWGQLSYPNLLPFYGLYYLEGRLCLVSPWMENGHVREFLMNAPSDTDRISLMLDIATGLEYLHTERVVHGDLKAVHMPIIWVPECTTLITRL
ncbi:kinase-like domain-containing protein [Mycena rosella]|uniref:Kinase-like domain-containing protein n=1 Tax=Mycena rosella TaxID=1033263 RepID=A0AAD7G6T8_MYCRO|nr:kinase-like domain-containing protein [Mycena rosella]